MIISKTSFIALTLAILSCLWAPSAQAATPGFLKNFQWPAPKTLNLGTTLYSGTMPFKSAHNNKLFKKDLIHQDVFGEWFWTKHFGLQISLGFSKSHQSDVPITAQSTQYVGNGADIDHEDYALVPVRSTQNTTLQSRYSLQSRTLAAVGEMGFKDDTLKIQGALGVALTTLKAEYFISKQDSQGLQGNNEQYLHGFKKTKLIPMLKATVFLNIQPTNSLSVFTTILWQHTSLFKEKHRDENSIKPEIRPKNQLNVGIGLRYQFL